MKKKNKKRKQSITGKYDIDFSNELNSGGNAIIYDVTSKTDKRQYVLKYLTASSEEKKRRFVNEIKTMIGLNSFEGNGVVKIIDYSEEYFWYVMPKMTPSFSFIASNNNITIEETIRLFLSLVKTVDMLHDRGLSHRDIKPDNIYIDNGVMVLGDFGLVDTSDSTQNLTKSDNPLGAIFTIAPEMKRTPDTSDGKKADVYSLAKTLWIFLSLKPKGFDGQYDFSDSTHGLRFLTKYQKTHIAEIEELLSNATNNDPDKRPNIKEFQRKLQEWETIFCNKELSQKKEWMFLSKIIFGDYSPKNATFDRLEDIYSVIKIISKSSTFNHVFFANGGGNDLVDVQYAPEKNCLYFVVDPNTIYVIKPKKLYFYSLKDMRWTYFLLELEDMQSSIPHDVNEKIECVVEDSPGHYVSAIDEIYGVYDYDSGQLLPKGYKSVLRCLHERFLITMKLGPYNGISSTYDGRHADCPPQEFAMYMENLSNNFDELRKKGYTEEDALSVLNKGTPPFKPKNESIQKDLIISDSESIPPFDFIKEEYPKWNLNECLIHQDNDSGLMHFYFALKHTCTCYTLSDFPNIDYDKLSDSSDKSLFIMKNGEIKASCNNNDAIIDSDAFYVSNREKAIMVRDSLNQEILKMCSGYKMTCFDYKVGIKIYTIRVAPPTHLFTKDELETKMREADDRQSNRIVVDEIGNILIVSGKIDYALFPVSHEQYMPRHNYVGKYSSLCHLDDTYNRLLQAWLWHLKTNKPFLCSDIIGSFDQKRLVDEIMEYYK